MNLGGLPSFVVSHYLILKVPTVVFTTTVDNLTLGQATLSIVIQRLMEVQRINLPSFVVSLC